ncbi:LacI family DNA-binding transcriptional regulator [Paenibacillus sp. FSL R7-0048]|uniref:LacI family transcriptional regulator n=1 Tax=Paenibacillus odorifer TaxID=189426 RepID=A0ABX3GWC5_9BACL|nr:MULTISPECIES: LacI family DNA-binding transcriptional regulator [Paenibacillus]MDH6427895.1 LacI family transcriptional regulator [Paenibacillus sp. PastH-4]MDH6444477.1 LacI family transcriptional regulator [Paenibacillus sp. PastF-4]MDH6528376.1 LacI family transcriptional regulator [Paenibacillus sp. PastH-3]OMC72662.1 LacI family transcriptional regulator [Paenibacillus odorifer]OMC73581.1 LacI family transcriptional regulator [Paenibacillus odorifer]
MMTIKDVAKIAGVSVATVSRVINESGYVNIDTRKKVEAAIKEMNYTPNEVARSLYKRKSKLIGLLLPDITNPFFPQLARGIEDRMQEQGYRIIFGNSDENEDKEMDYIQTFIQNNVIGMISSTNFPESDVYSNLKIPVVFLDRTSNDSPSVYADGKKGGRLAAQEIIARGSKKITVIQGPAHIKPAQDRFLGAIEVLNEMGISYNVIETSSFSHTVAEQWAVELFDKYIDTDGVIASNDIVATAVIHEAHRLGKRVPQDLQIIGFDDIPLSSLLSPALSTIRQPAHDMGREAAGLLIKLIEQDKVEEKIIQLPVSFVERETTRSKE